MTEPIKNPAVVMAGRDQTNTRDVYIEIDPTTGDLIFIPRVHDEIHEGDFYSLRQSAAADAFDIAGPMTFHITTPNTTKWAHIAINVAMTGQVLLEIFEDDGNAAHFDVSGGSAVTPFQHNRNSSNTSGLTVATGVTVTQATADVKIFSVYIGAAGPQGAGSAVYGDREEIILKQNTEYLIRLTTVADNNEGSFEVSWYEHTNLS